MANEIRHRISLEGDDDVKNRLKDVGETGKKSFEGIHETIGKSGEQADKTGDLLQKLKEKLLAGGEEKESHGSGGGEGGGEGKTGKLSGGIKEALGAAAEGAELNLGNQVGAVVIAARAGVASLALTISGLLVGALEKLGDEINDQIARLAAFTGSIGKAKEAREQIGSVADELKLPASGLGAPYEQLLRANKLQQPKDQLDADGQQDVLRTLFNGANADRVSFDKAAEGITALLADLRKNGQLTTEGGEAANDLFPKFMERLIAALQDNFGKDKYYTTPQVLQTIRQIGPQVAQDAATTQKELPSSIPDAWTTLKAASEKLGEEVSGGHAIASALEDTAKFIDATAGGVKKIKEAAARAALDRLADKPVPVETANRIRAERGVEPVTPPLNYKQPDRAPSEHDDDTPVGIKFLQYILGVKGETYQPEGSEAPSTSVGIGSDAAGSERAAAASGVASKALEKLGESADQAGKKLTEGEINKFEKELPVISSRLNTKQAGIDYEHKKEETDIKLGRDDVAVENAKIARQQAEIGQLEAQKNKDQAALAPEAAQENLENAGSSLRKARHNFNQQHGIGDNFDPVREAQIDSEEALNSAETAFKRARIERNYAYLEPKKAELAGKKAETDVRSAEYLERDTELTKAKDNEGKTLSTDVAGLRYAQAQLDEQKANNRFNNEQVELLQDILNALHGSSASHNGQAAETSAQEKTAAPKEAERSTPLNGEGPTYRIDENGDRVDSTIADVLHYNKAAAARRVPPVQPLDDAPQRGVTSGQESGQPAPQPTPQPQPQPTPTPQPQQPAPQPEQHSQTEQPQQPAQQVADLRSFAREIAVEITAAVDRIKPAADTKVQGPVDGLGVRGEAAPEPAASKDVAQLGDAADKTEDSFGKVDSGLDELAAKLADVASTDEPTKHAAGGGHITGPGTSTSDSIPAYLSNDEHVINAREARRNRPVLNAINAGTFPAQIARMFANGGRIEIPHFAVGGAVADGLSSVDLGSVPTVHGISEAGDGSKGHYNVDLRTNHGDFPMLAPEDVAKRMSAAARDSSNAQTGPRPSWYRGK